MERIKVVNMKTKNIGLILAKSNSVGLPGKNTFEIGGETLLSIGIRQMLCAGIFSDIFVSSDSKQILAEAEQLNAKAILRDEHLTANSAYTEAVRHAVNKMPSDFDTVTISQIVQPAKSSDLWGRIMALHDDDVDSVVTVKAFESSPTWLFQGSDKSDQLAQIGCINYDNVIARSSDIYEIDNKVVSFTRSSFLTWDSITPWPYLGNRIKYLEDRVVNSNLALDINTAEDWKWLKILTEKGIWHA